MKFIDTTYTVVASGGEYDMVQDSIMTWKDAIDLAHEWQKKYPEVYITQEKKMRVDGYEIDFYTPDKQTYYDIDHAYKLQDARRHVFERFYIHEDDKDTPYAQQTLEMFDLEELVDDFEQNFNCDVPENYTWDTVVGDYIWHLKHDDDDEEGEE